MKNSDVAKKNYDRGLWTDEMMDKLVEKGKVSKADVDKIKADKAAKK